MANQQELDDIEEVRRRVFQDGWLERMQAADGWHCMYGKDGPSIVRTSEGSPSKPTAKNYRDVRVSLSATCGDISLGASKDYLKGRHPSQRACTDARNGDPNCADQRSLPSPGWSKPLWLRAIRSAACRQPPSRP